MRRAFYLPRLTSIPPHPYLLSNDTAPTAIYTLSLHDALPIFYRAAGETVPAAPAFNHSGISVNGYSNTVTMADRKSTRLNSSHVAISYAVFCLKKKIKKAERTKNGT